MKLIALTHLRVIASDPVPDGTGERSNLLNFKKIASSLRSAPRNDTIFILCVFSFFILFCSSCQSQPAQDLVCFQKQCVQVEVAQKPEELTRGLQLREHLSPDAGMLFIFSYSQKHNFWMKDTKIPLDMIWLDESRRVVYIKHNAPPCVQKSCTDHPGQQQEMEPCPVYTPDQEAMYVLEINGGATDRFKIHIGDTAVFQFNRRK